MVSEQPTATFFSARARENHAVHQLFRDACLDPVLSWYLFPLSPSVGRNRELVSFLAWALPMAEEISLAFVGRKL